MSMKNFMDKVNRDLKEDTGTMLEELKLKMQNMVMESKTFHITQQDLEEADKIEEFAKATSEGYDIQSLESYRRGLWTLIFTESNILDIKETEIYGFLITLLPEFAEYLNIDYLATIKDVDKYSSAEYHKRVVYEKACELCLEKKTITLNTALKHIIRKEQEGIPAYLQIIGKRDFLTAFIEELKKWVIFIKEHETQILLSFLS